MYIDDQFLEYELNISVSKNVMKLILSSYVLITFIKNMQILLCQSDSAQCMGAVSQLWHKVSIKQLCFSNIHKI